MADRNIPVEGYLPSVEAGEPSFLILVRNGICVECLVMGVLEFSLGETLVVVDCPVADELHLRYTWNSLEIRMKDRLLRLARLIIPVAVALRVGIEGLGKLVRRIQSNCSNNSYLGQSILLLWSDNNAREEQGVVLIRGFRHVYSLRGEART